MWYVNGILHRKAQSFLPRVSIHMEIMEHFLQNERPINDRTFVLFPLLLDIRSNRMWVIRFHRLHSLSTAHSLFSKACTILFAALQSSNYYKRSQCAIKIYTGETIEVIAFYSYAKFVLYGILYNFIRLHYKQKIWNNF